MAIGIGTQDGTRGGRAGEKQRVVAISFRAADGERRHGGMAATMTGQ